MTHGPRAPIRDRATDTARVVVALASNSSRRRKSAFVCALLLAEHPELWRMRKSNGAYRWSYTPGLVGLGLLRLHGKAPEARFPAYVRAYVDRSVDADGVGAFLLASAEIE